MEFPFVSVIIVNYNGAHYLPTCLDALSAQTYPSDCFEVIVSDNNSEDGSIQLLEQDYPWVKVISNERNLGFAAGNNVAIITARGKYIVLLNNDTMPMATWLENMVKIAQDHPRAGLVTGHLQLFYDQLTVEIETETFRPSKDDRILGIQIYQVDSGAKRGVVQFLEGFYGIENHPSGQSFRWTGEKALLGVPVPVGNGDWLLDLKLAAPRPDNRDVGIKIQLQDEVIKECRLSGEASHYHVEMPSSTRKHANPVEQNTGSIIFRNGGGRDRGTYVKNSELFFENDQGQYNQIEEVFAGCGASLLLKRDMLQDVGLFDDDFFMYYEDTDLSWRARLRNWKVIYAPDAIVRHIHVGSSKEWSPFFSYLVDRNRLAMVFKNGTWNQVMRVWGGFLLKFINLGWTSLTGILSHPSNWRGYASQIRIHLRVFASLFIWQPSLWRKRYKIQKLSLVKPEELSIWFLE
jgi:GT2 family glycosyltransferase